MAEEESSDSPMLSPPDRPYPEGQPHQSTADKHCAAQTDDISSSHLDEAVPRGPDAMSTSEIPAAVDRSIDEGIAPVRAVSPMGPNDTKCLQMLVIPEVTAGRTMTTSADITPTTASVNSNTGVPLVMSTDKDTMAVNVADSKMKDTTVTSARDIRVADSDSRGNAVNAEIRVEARTMSMTSPDSQMAVRPKCPDNKTLVSMRKSPTSIDSGVNVIASEIKKLSAHSDARAARGVEATVACEMAAQRSDNSDISNTINNSNNDNDNNNNNHHKMNTNFGSNSSNSSSSTSHNVVKSTSPDNYVCIKVEKSVGTSDNHKVSESILSDMKISGVEKSASPDLNSQQLSKSVSPSDVTSSGQEKSERLASTSHSLSVGKPATSEVAVNTHVSSDIQVNKSVTPDSGEEKSSLSHSGTHSVAARSTGCNPSRAASDQLVSPESTSTTSCDRVSPRNQQDSISDKPASPDQTLPDTSEITPITPDIPDATPTPTPRSLSCEREPSYQQRVRCRPDTIEVNHATQTDTPELPIESVAEAEAEAAPADNQRQQLQDDYSRPDRVYTPPYESLPATRSQHVATEEPPQSEYHVPSHHAVKRPPPPPIPPHPPASIVQRNYQSNGGRQLATIHTGKALSKAAPTSAAVTGAAMSHVTSTPTAAMMTTTTFRKQPNSVAPVSHPPIPIKHHRRASQGLLPQLTHVDQLLIKQRLPVAELRRNSDFNNKYTLRTILGQDVFRAEEATTLCARDCCGPDRAFHMKIVDLHGRPVIALERPPWLNVCCCCPLFPVCQQETQIEAPPGSVVGVIREEQTWFGVSPRFAVNDPDGKLLYGIQGPTCPRVACFLDGDIDFTITDSSGVEVGRVSKEWDNLPKELLATSDNFGVAFPEEIPPSHKALLIGVAFILDFVYYEREREKYSRTGLAQQIPSVANSRRSSSQHSDTSNEVNENFSAWGGGIETHSRGGGGDGGD